MRPDLPSTSTDTYGLHLMGSSNLHLSHTIAPRLPASYAFPRRSQYQSCFAFFVDVEVEDPHHSRKEKRLIIIDGTLQHDIDGLEIRVDDVVAPLNIIFRVEKAKSIVPKDFVIDDRNHITLTCSYIIASSVLGI